jgi:hypothetical protein
MSESLRDVLYALSVAQEVPDAILVDDFVRRFPDYASEITEFAIELAADAIDDANGDSESAEAGVSAEVSRAMSRFQNRLHAVRNGPERSSMRTMEVAAVENPFAALDRVRFRQLTERLNVNTVFVAKLRDRQISPSTIPKSFQNRVAKELDVPVELLAAHFAAKPEAHVRQFYKAEGKPTERGQQSFEEAVRTSGLTDEQRADLIAL